MLFAAWKGIFLYGDRLKRIDVRDWTILAVQRSEIGLMSRGLPGDV
jgi:hypothetical protein